MASFWKPGSSATTTNNTRPRKSDDDRHASIIVNQSLSHLPIHRQRQQLPITRHRRQILYALYRHRVVVIVGETGSGKSTQLPQILHEGGWTKSSGINGTPKMIVCTQPRRIAATTLAARVASERAASRDGSAAEVGYAVRFDDQTSPSTRIKYVTDGMLLRETLQDPLLSKYRVIIVDEAHERSMNSDVVLGLVKKIGLKRKDLRVVVCSATIDAQAFLTYFCGETATGGENENDNDRRKKRKRTRWGKRIGNDGNPPETETDEPEAAGGVILSIDGRVHPVDVLHVEEPCGNYVEKTVDVAFQIHETETKQGGLQAGYTHGQGDILCFLPTAEDIDSAIRIATEKIDVIEEGRSKQSRNASKDTTPHCPITVLPLYGSLPHNLQARVFQTKPKHNNNTTTKHTPRFHRRMIFATNIAETSVTIPDISFVVDCGFTKLPFYDPTNGYERLVVCPISRASAKQRAGRAGRVGPGKCYRLYTEAHMTSSIMPETTAPEILRTDLSSFVLMMKAFGVDNVILFDMMTQPSPESISHALECLYALGAMNDECDLTSLGYKMCEFPTEPRISRMLLSSLYDHHCAEEVLSVAAVLQVRNIFVLPRTRQQRLDCDASMGELCDKSGDHVTYANLLDRDWFVSRAAMRDHREEIRGSFLNPVTIARAMEVRAQLRRFLRRYGPIRRFDAPEDTAPSHQHNQAVSEAERSIRIRKSVACGFFVNTARLENDGHYYTLRGKHRVTVSSDSALNRSGGSINTSPYIMFGETYDGSQGDLEVRACSSIRSLWLKELAPHYWQ